MECGSPHSVNGDDNLFEHGGLKGPIYSTEYHARPVPLGDIQLLHAHDRYHQIYLYAACVK